MSRTTMAWVAGTTVMGLCLGAVTLAARATVADRRALLEQETRVALYQAATRLRSTLDKQRIALEQMATFVENSERVTPAEFEAFASATIRRLPSCLRISLTDADYRILMVHPREPNRAMLGFDLRRHAQGHEVLRQARTSRETVFSPPLQLIGGPPGFVVAVPIFRGRRFLGALVGTYKGDVFSASLVVPELLRRHDTMVLNSGVPLFSSRPEGLEHVAGSPTASEHFSLGDTPWEVRLKARPESARESLRSGMAAFWTLGVLGSICAGVLAGLAAGWMRGLRARIATQGDALEAAHRRLDDAMRQLLQAEKMTSLGELVAGVAHEMNNPLASIMGYTQLMLGHDLPEPLRRRLETVNSEAERMARIVKNLLTFARKHPPERTLQELGPLIQRTLELKAYHFRVNQIRVEQALEPGLPKTLMDAHQIQQVLLNLLNNAEQAFAEGGRGGSIRISARAHDGRLELCVADDGPGIPVAIQDRIFEPFFTTKKDGKGTGLGLSLCYGIVQEHGGTIRVQPGSTPGAAFVIELPVVETQAETAALAPRGAAAAEGRLSVLVVDPEQAVSRFMVDLLTSRGHRVATAADVPEALRAIAGQERLDLIIAALRMPQGSGQDLYRALESDNPQLLRRIIFTSGDGSSRETQEFIRRTGAELLQKPCRIEDLDRAIARTTRGDGGTRPL
ncbi:MAG: ATP-binding protein [Candidatus Polarisedimenticolia bacterium]